MGIFKSMLKTMSGTQAKTADITLNKVYAFYSERSSGVTTTMLNAAAILATQYKKKILIIDTNILFPMSRYYLIPADGNYKGTDLLYITDTNEKQEIVSDTKYENIKLISVLDNNLDTVVSTRDTGDLIEYVIDTFISDYDYIFIDVDKQLTNIALKSLMLSDVVIQVYEDSASDFANITKVKSLFDAFGLNSEKASFVVLNKRLLKRTLDKTELDKVGYSIISVIPYWEQRVTMSMERKLCMSESSVPKLINQGFSALIEFIIGGSI